MLEWFNVTPKEFIEDEQGIIFREAPPDLLYHYTTLEGFLGMLESKSIWLSSIKFMNDSEEFKHSVRLVRQITMENYGEEFLENVAPYDDTLLSTYSFSFSKEYDLLSQWRGYCFNGGLSFSFKKEILNKFLETHDLFLGKCIYEESDQLDLLKRKCFRVSPDTYLNEKTKNFYAVSNQICHDIMVGIHKYGGLIKHKKFAEENEWRLLKYSWHGFDREEDVKLRAGKGSFIPFVPLKICEEKIEKNMISTLFSSIVIGPSPQQKLIKEALVMLDPESEGLIQYSEVPYRQL